MIPTIKEHRSVRRFQTDKAIPEPVMIELLEAAARASNTGNMQVYSIVVSASEEVRNQLAPCHFNQPAATSAPVLVTFCADLNRFSRWCRQRGAEPGYDNFMWFINGTIDSMLASENFALEAQAHGLGICYLGTTTYTAKDIVRILELPKGVVPVTTIAVGYPAEPIPPLADRLPLAGIVHWEKYTDYSDADIDRIWAERETSEETAGLLKENDLPNLALIFTERRYKKEDSLHFSRAYLEVLKTQGLFEF